MGSGKIELIQADIISIKILNHISSSMIRSEVAGSIRRRKPVVGDIEIVGIPGDQQKIIKLIHDIGQTIKPGISDIIPWVPKPNAKYIRVRLNEGMNLDLFLANSSNWGGILLMRTGSGSDANGNSFNGFTQRVFSRWKKISKGGRMKDAMPTLPSGEQLTVPEEKTFFDLLEMNFVPPIERTDYKAIKRYSKNN